MMPAQQQDPNLQVLCIKVHLTFDLPVLADEAVRDFTLDAYTTTTSITDLTPDLDYSVSILSYYGSEESIPIFGQLTSKLFILLIYFV